MFYLIHFKRRRFDIKNRRNVVYRQLYNRKKIEKRFEKGTLRY